MAQRGQFSMANDNSNVDSVRGSIRGSNIDSNLDSIRGSDGDSNRDSIVDSVRNSDRDSIVDSVRYSKIDSILDSVLESVIARFKPVSRPPKPAPARSRSAAPGNRVWRLVVRRRPAASQLEPGSSRRWRDDPSNPRLLEVRPETGGLGHAIPNWRGEDEVLLPFRDADEIRRKKQEKSQL